MNNEYWLQKKTIGGWSQVTWYADKDQAMANFNNITRGDTGYSWRLIEANTVVEKLLEEVVEIEAPEFIPNFKKAERAPVRANPILDSRAQGDWSKPMGASPIENAGALAHKGKGQIWVVNRTTAHKTKIDPARLQEFEANGYERGGPRS